MRTILIMSIILITPNISFGNYLCEGTIKLIGTDLNGLHINNGYGVHRICNLSTPGESDMCKSWLSMAMSAQSRNVPLGIYYRDNTGKSKDHCSNIGSWVTPDDKVYFVQIVK